MLEQRKNPSRTYNRVAEFYEGKSVFLTGASGYVGVVILETLLRCCPGIRSIYILLREKKGVTPECRKEVMFKKKIFYKLKEEQPEVLDKVHVMAGDVTLSNMGMSQEDLLEVTHDVTIVFHVAGCISFLKPLRFMLTQNSRPMDYVIDLCRKLKKIDVLVYTSTSFSNSNRKIEIEEEIYRLPFPAQRFLNELNHESPDSVNNLAAQCLPRWPNFYTFSKCLAENIILDNASDIPSVIVRPSIIVSCWKGILPGYVEEGSGVIDLTLAIARGFVRVYHGDPKVKMDLIPVDIVANAHVVAAWSVATGRSTTPMVVNCTASESCRCTVFNYNRALFDMEMQHPLPKAFQKLGPLLIIKKSFLAYALFSLVEHYVLAFLIDTFFILRGEKPRLVSLYRIYDKAMTSLLYFGSRDWTFHRKNFQSLDQQLGPEDKEILYTDVDGFTAEEMFDKMPSGAPFYDWDTDPKRKDERMRTINMRYKLIMFIKTAMLTCILTTLCFVISRVL